MAQKTHPPKTGATQAEEITGSNSSRSRGRSKGRIKNSQQWLKWLKWNVLPKQRKKKQQKERNGRRRQRQSNGNGRYIPIDLQEEIIARLPGRDLVNFKSVCKYWLQLISSPRFILKYSDRSSRRNRIVMPSPSYMIVYDDDDGESGVVTRIPYPQGFCIENTKLVGSCDGLICLVDTENKYIAIINPSIGKYDLRPINGVKLDPTQSFWFGHCPSSTEEYVLIIVSPWFPCMSIQTYQFSTKQIYQRSICSVPMRALCYRSTGLIFLHGNLLLPAKKLSMDYLVVRPERYVVFEYDIDKDENREISTPFEQFPFTLGVVDGSCLSAVCKTGEEMFELWIMKEYGVDESWTKYGSIEGLRFKNCKELLPLGFLPGGDLLLDVDRSRVVKYSFRDKKDTLVQVYQVHDWSPLNKKVLVDNAIVCADSLVSLGRADSLVSPALIWGE